MSESPIESTVLSPAERRQRNRKETTDAILAAARASMQEHGVAALNLSEVARRVHMRPQSLSEYFPNKAALYDALIEQAFVLIREGDESAYRDHEPGWAQIEAWFTNRIELAIANPDLYHLAFDAPVPGYVPTDPLIAMSRNLLAKSHGMIANAVEAGAMEPGVPIEQATDILLALRRGLIAERLGKRRFSDRFDGLLPAAIQMLKTAWAPVATQRATTTCKGDAHT